MIKISVLERMLFVERERRRATVHGDFGVPAMSERSGNEEQGPFIATNMRGSFLQTRLSREGCVRFGYCECPLDREDELFVALVRALVAISEDQGWSNRCRTLGEGVKRIQGQGLQARHMVVGWGQLGDACSGLSREEAEMLMMGQGFVAELDEGLRVLVGPLPSGLAMITTSPSMLGVYSRIDNWLGLLIHRADRAVVLVDDDLG